MMKKARSRLIPTRKIQRKARSFKRKKKMNRKIIKSSSNMKRNIPPILKIRPYPSKVSLKQK